MDERTYVLPGIYDTRYRRGRVWRSRVQVLSSETEIEFLPLRDRHRDFLDLQEGVFGSDVFGRARARSRCAV